AVALGEKELLGRVREISKKIADAATEGLQEDGSMINERNNQTGEENRNRDWWPQAETVVGYMNAYQLTNNEVYLDISLHCWNFIKKNLVDNMAGEWFWGISEKGIINTKDDKAGFWKCPYHNGRMCLEIMRR
ncbi:MAG: AGE family epimerase/isomerase, partial [Bacteroidota bacterium]|nr:AGE family epimerase/isomerase [Bacteroidota bacterium]MDP4274606.1 AGE family epimerase/isomerase [Bacteroidota bacterium]